MFKGTRFGDTYSSYRWGDYIDGNGGNDNLTGYLGSDRIWGDGGDDQLVGRSGDDVLRGGTGNDLIYGDGWGGEAGGADVLYGDKGVDHLIDAGADYFHDRLYGGDGNDFLWTGTGFDESFGGRGDDAFALMGGIAKGGPGRDQFYTNTGEDYGVPRYIYGHNNTDASVDGRSHFQIILNPYDWVPTEVHVMDWANHKDSILLQSENVYSDQTNLLSSGQVSALDENGNGWIENGERLNRWIDSEGYEKTVAEAWYDQSKGGLVVTGGDGDKVIFHGVDTISVQDFIVW